MAVHRNASPALAERRRVIVVLDLAGFTRAVGALGAMELARLVDDFYGVADAAVVDHGGRVVKFVGDGCLALFAEDDAEGALACVDAVASGLPALTRAHGVPLELGANVHRSVVVEGEFGGGSSRRFDVIGPGIIHAYRMGGGAGVRISEPVYRQVPNERRGGWEKRQPPATYTRRVS
jgi:adenylate cyclase